jgi:hypothetical protein
LHHNYGSKSAEALYKTVRSELIGASAASRAPPHGLGRIAIKLSGDDLVVYEIMVEIPDRNWWHHYRTILESRFQQQSFVD